MAYLLIGITAIILIPILYVVPMGLSLKGKHLVASSTFLLAMVGAAASATYPLWMILLMLVMTLCLMAYLMDQRVAGLLSASAVVPAGDGAMAGILNDVEAPDKTAPVIHSVKEETFVETVTDAGTAPAVEPEQPAEAEDDESEWFVESGHEGSDPVTSAVSDELELEEEEIMLGSWFETVEPEEGLEEDLERMFIQPLDQETPLQAIQEDEALTPYMDELFEEEGNSEEGETEGHLPGLLHELEDLSSVVTEEGSRVEVEEEKAADVLEGGLDEEDFLLDEETLEHMASHEGKGDSLEETVSRPRIDGPIMKTMLEIIAFSETSLPKEEFQELVNSYLHPALHDRDYYTFAKILIDHHLLHAQYEACSTFITEMEDRFRSYGYLSEELTHIKQYAQNQMN